MRPDDAARRRPSPVRQRDGGHRAIPRVSRRLWLDELRQDFRAAARNLVRYPVVAIVAVLSLGAGIGATAASLTIRDVIFQNPPPLYVEPQQLSKVQVNRRDRPIRPMGSSVPGDLYLEWRSAIGPGDRRRRRARRRQRRAHRLIASSPTRVRAVTANFFSVLGVGPKSDACSRRVATADRSPPEAILSYRLWQEWFGGRPDAIGAPSGSTTSPHTVIGVHAAAVLVLRVERSGLDAARARHADGGHATFRSSCGVRRHERRRARDAAARLARRLLTPAARRTRTAEDARVGDQGHADCRPDVLASFPSCSARRSC